MDAHREHLKAITKVAVSLLLLLLVVAGVGVDGVLRALRTIAPSSWIKATVLLWLAYGVTCFRWWCWVKALRQPLTMTAAGSSYVSAIFFNMVLPTGVGGDVVRTWELARAGLDVGVLLASAIVDRVMGLAAAVALALVCLSMYPDALHQLAAASWLLLVACVAALAIAYATYPLFEQKILARFAGQAHGVSGVLAKMGECFRLCRTRWKDLATTFALSLAAHGLITLCYVELAHALGISLSLGMWLLIVPLVFLAQTVPIAMGGLGLREAAVVVLLIDAGVSREAATALSLVYLAVLWLSVLPGGMWAAYKWIRKSKVTA